MPLNEKIKTVNNTILYWRKLLIAIIVTTIAFILLSYDILLSLDPYLFIIVAIGIFTTFIFLIGAIRKSINFRQFPPKWTLISCIILMVCMPLNYCYSNGFFWGKKIIEAAFLDDRSRMDLTLYENEHFIINSKWLFGDKTFTGKYHIKGDTIEFTKFPVIDNDFVAKTIIRKDKKIYFRLNDPLNYDTTFYYFQINFDNNR